MSCREDKNPLAHVPFVVILVKAMNEWKISHSGSAPSNIAEKGEFRKIIENQMLSLEPKDRENFEEALNKLYWAYKDSSIVPDNLAVLFDHENCVNFMNIQNDEDKKFWTLVKALKEFREKNSENNLPVDRRIPDMKSTSEWYIQLKEVY